MKRGGCGEGMSAGKNQREGRSEGWITGIPFGHVSPSSVLSPVSIRSVMQWRAQSEVNALREAFIHTH